MDKCGHSTSIQVNFVYGRKIYDSKRMENAPLNLSDCQLFYTSEYPGNSYNLVDFSKKLCNNRNVGIVTGIDTDIYIHFYVRSQLGKICGLENVQ